MVPGGADTIVAVDAHPSFGPVVSFGLGGAFADAIGDRAVRALPPPTWTPDLVRSSRAFRQSMWGPAPTPSPTCSAGSGI